MSQHDLQDDISFGFNPNAPQVEAMKQFQDAKSIVASQEDRQMINVSIS